MRELKKDLAAWIEEKEVVCEEDSLIWIEEQLHQAEFETDALLELSSKLQSAYSQLLEKVEPR